MKKRLMAIMSLACVLLVCAFQPQTLAGAPAGPSVAKYVRPDGRIDLEAVRASGYEGSLDLKGFDLRLDRRSGEPMVRPSGAGRALDNPDDRYWSEGFHVPGMSWTVVALTVYDNKVIAGGGFSGAGDVMVNYIAAWDGSAWSALGSGMNLDINALTIYDKTLMVGGHFTTAGDKVSGYIAQWTKGKPEATLLQSFAASYRGSGVEVKWELSEQVSRESFVIERAECPDDFVELHGAEITESGLHYDFNDTGIEPGMKYRYRVVLSKKDGSRESLFETEEIAIPTLPVTLFQNHPNPFNPSTMIRYYLPEGVEVTFGVYDARGCLVASLAERERQASGYHSVEWNGRDASGNAAASGVYFYRLKAGKLMQSRKMILLYKECCERSSRI